MSVWVDQSGHDVGVRRTDDGQLNVLVVVFQVLRSAGVGVY